MNQSEQVTLRDHLIAANRVLITLATIDPKERTTLMSPAICECMQVYADLLKFQVTLPPAAPETASVQAVLERLKAYLQYFGEDV
jgi:hypothetical protein